MPSIFSFSQSNDTSSKLARLARAQKRGNNANTHINSARKAQRVDCNPSQDSHDMVDCTTVRDSANCDVSIVGVNISSDVSTDNVICDVSSVQDNGDCNTNISNTDLTGNNDCTIPDVSTVDNTVETTETAVVSCTQGILSALEGQQLQAAMEYITTLTDQNNSLQTECYHLMAANTELFHKSVVLQYECNKLDAKKKELKTSMGQALKEIRKEAFGYANIEENDEQTCHYTGLPTYSVFTTLFDLLKPFVVNSSSKSAAKEENTAKNQFYATLIKLRHNVPMNDLAYRLHVTEATVSKFFHKWLKVMYCNLKQLIIWPDSETLRQTLPSVFHTHFTQVKCIIDCFEIFIERPVAFTARAATYSNYKKHNTVKVFIGVSPTGTISYISSAWGGRVSDKVITQQCGFLQYIDPGDVILADRGFNIHDDVAIRGGKLEIPAFTKGKKQLSREEVEKSRQISRVRIHVERVIGQLRKKYTILAGPLPISLIKKPTDNDTTTIDRILIVTAALINLCKSVVQ